MHEVSKDRQIEILTAINEALASRVAFLNKRKMRKTELSTEKWRGQAMYYKKRCRLLIEKLEGHGASMKGVRDEEN